MHIFPCTRHDTTKDTGAALFGKHVEFCDLRKTASGSCLALGLSTFSGTLDVEIAPQNEKGGFDWDSAVSISLDIVEIGELLAVLRAMRDCVRDGKGIVRKYADVHVTLDLTHTYEPIPAVFRFTAREISPHKRSVDFVFDYAVACSLAIVLDEAIRRLAF